MPTHIEYAALAAIVDNRGMRRAWRSKLLKLALQMSAAAAAIWVGASGALARPVPPSICRELGQVLSSPKEFALRSPAYFVDRPCARSRATAASAPGVSQAQCTEIFDGPSTIPNVDVDGDGLLDGIHFECSGAGARPAADPCKAEIRFGGGGTLVLDGYYPLILLKGNYYAIGADYSTEPSGLRSEQAFRITRKGLILICRSL